MIGKRIKELRKKQGLSMSRLAAMAGVAKSYLSELEKNDSINPSVQYVKKIADVLEVNVDDLIFEEIEYFNEEKTIDAEWMQLMHQAIKTGLTKEQFRAITRIVKKAN